jgi:hypothetical protein
MELIHHDSDDVNNCDASDDNGDDVRDFIHNNMFT